MQDLFKKFIYTGVGLVSLTAETLKSSVDKMVEDSKLSTDEGKKMVEEFLKNTESKRDEFESQLKSLIEKVVANFKFISEGDFKEVLKRLETLEGDVTATAKEAATKMKDAFGTAFEGTKEAFSDATATVVEAIEDKLDAGKDDIKDAVAEVKAAAKKAKA